MSWPRRKHFCTLRSGDTANKRISFALFPAEALNLIIDIYSVSVQRDHEKCGLDHEYYQNGLNSKFIPAPGSARSNFKDLDRGQDTDILTV